MRTTNLLHRITAIFLAVMLLVSTLPMSSAAEASSSLAFEQVENNTDLNLKDAELTAEEPEESAPYNDDDTVRVSIVCEQEPLLAVMGCDLTDVAHNEQAMAYREQIKQEQAAVEADIEDDVLDGKDLDVVWNLTLVANIISANVQYGQIAEIASIPGVVSVEVEARYEPQVLDQEEAASPNMATSSSMIGTSAAWSDGYTGAGMRIAVIDTGLNTDHISFNTEAFEYSLKQQAEKADLDYEAYLSSLDLLDVDEIAGIWDELHVSEELPTCTAADVYGTTKLPFQFNYVDVDLDVTHKNDSQGNHGSHVAGISTANAYIKNDDGTFSDALTTTAVRGVAPDAQLLVMKVFGKSGGAFESDYVVAIEDAILLGCDAINLSLGSANAGFARSNTYQNIMDSLTNSSSVVSIAAGNAGHAMDNSYALPGYLFGDDVSADTVGTPGSNRNSLAVASADNDGSTGNFLQFNGELYYFTETSYSNEPIRTLAGDHEFVLLDSIGTAEEFASVADEVNGRIALCYRGTTAFFEKANAAVANGAIGVIIINNVADQINMQLDDYTGTAPVVLAAMELGDALKSLSEQKTAGDLTYYVGTMTISTTMVSSNSNAEYYTLSSFSSWGVPGDLSMKPEITAPGGSIYSVGGTRSDNADFQTMSGTSMAAPQITGMAALVAQMIERKGLAEESGLTNRQLAQSLLMSTAHPMTNGETGALYSILQQGAGLANVGDAVMASSYIQMDDDASETAFDGKVKVELGDDPDRIGSYSWTFTINNFSDSEKSYTLSTDLFTQDLFDQYGYTWLDTATTALAADVVYLVDGRTFVPRAALQADVNNDGNTDATDALLVLQLAVGASDGNGLNLTAADVNGDGAITSYDAHLILRDMHTEAFAVAANDSVSVMVQVSLTAEQKATLNQKYENGAYIEGFTYVTPVATAEGALTDVEHSIPVLGFYGNWSDPSMFDRTTFTEYYYGKTDPVYTGTVGTNNLVFVQDGDNTGYYMSGNLYLKDDAYYPERNALNSKARIYQYYLTMIRNAASVFAQVTNQDGELLYRTTLSSQIPSAFYYTGSESWMNTVGTLTMDKTAARLGASEGDVLTVSLYAIPEYYEQNGKLTSEEIDELLASGVLGDGVALHTSFTVDNTAPVLLDAQKSLAVDDQLTITAQDNNYIACIAILNEFGAKVFAKAKPEQNAGNETVSYTFDLSEIPAGEYITVLLADYAGNERSYKLHYGGEGEDFTNKMYGFTNGGASHGTGDRWVEIDPNTVFTYYDSTAKTYEYGGIDDIAFTDLGDVIYGEYVDGYVFAAVESREQPSNIIKTTLYAVPHESPDQYRQVCVWENIRVSGMSYNYSDNKMYLLTTTRVGGNDISAAAQGINTMWTVDLNTGDLTQAYTMTLHVPGESHVDYPKTDYMFEQLRDIAIDKNGVFYGISHGIANNNTRIYKWTNNDVVDGHIEELQPVSTELLGFAGMNPSMAWDHDNHILYCAAAASSGDSDQNVLITIDPETGKGTRTTVNSGGHSPDCAAQTRINITSLYVVPSFSGHFDTVEQATGIWTSDSSVSILAGSDYTVSASLYPWNLEDASVSWTSSDPSIATVEDGKIHGVTPGNTTITVTSNVTNTISASIAVEIKAVPAYTLNAMTYDADGNTQWIRFSTDDAANYTVIADSDRQYYSGTDYQDQLMLHDGNAAYLVDPETRESTLVSELDDVLLWSDAAYSPSLGYKSTPTMSDEGIAIVCQDGKSMYLLSLNEDGTANGLFPFGLSPFLENNDRLGAIAYAGRYSGGNLLTKYTSNSYYFISENGTLYTGNISKIQMGMMIQPLSGSVTAIGNLGIRLGQVASVGGGQFCSMVYDKTTGYLILSSYYLDNLNDVYIIDPVACNYVRLGDFGQDIGPVVSLYWDFPEADADAASANTDLFEAQLLANLEEETYVTAEYISLDEALSMQSEPANQVNGSTNVATGSPETAQPEKDDVVVDWLNQTLTVNVYGENTSNGTFTLDYDPNLLTFVRTSGTGELNVSCDNGSGTVTIGYANTNAGSYTGQVTFSFANKFFLSTTLTLTTTEDGSTTMKQTESLEVRLPTTESGTTPSVPGGSSGSDSFPFVDVKKSDRYYDAIKYLYEHGIMNGISATEYGPQLNLTRGMVVTILYRMSGEPSVIGLKNQFSDVLSDYYYTEAVTWAAQNSVVNGYPDGTFQPEGNVTREQLAAIIRRYAQLNGIVIAEPTTTLSPSSVVSDWAKADVNWANAQGILSGTQTANTTQAATRAEVATAIYTYLMKTAR